jgi:acetylornithine deacetylase/succinyl-diaminopimelate desuccinylase-like protein
MPESRLAFSRRVRPCAAIAIPALACFVAALPALPTRAQTPPPPAPPRVAALDWDSLGAETVRVLSEYLRINTTNPPGGELQTALFLQRLLAREGIEAQILDTAALRPGGRANLYARLKGTGAKRAIALVHHMDVVPADPRYWSVGPFSGVVKNGYVWGRGAQDMKGTGIIQLMALIAMKRSGIPLDRDVVFIANADEELGSTGAEVFVERHADLLRDVEFLLTEGGGASVENGRLTGYAIGTSEKRTFWQTLVVHGTPSHGSRPTTENPVPRLVAALNRIAQWETPLRVTPTTERVFRDIAPDYTGEQRTWLADVRRALADARGREWLLSNPGWNALLRNTISLTVLTGSNKTNVIPAEASAELDVRLLPDEDADRFLAELKAVAADTAVHFENRPPRPPMENPIDTELWRAIERVAHQRFPGLRVTPSMSTGATDRPIYRKLGIVTYGFSPSRGETDEEVRRGAHGNDERISVENVHFGVRFLYDVLRGLR